MILMVLEEEVWDLIALFLQSNIIHVIPVSYTHLILHIASDVLMYRPF